MTEQISLFPDLEPDATTDTENVGKRWDREIRDLTKVARSTGAKDAEIVKAIQSTTLYDFVTLGTLYDQYAARRDATR